MRIKDVTPLELHIEKIILGVAALFAVVVVYLFFLGEPYVVDIGGKLLKPGEVEDEVVRVSDELEKRIAENAKAPPEMEKMEVPPYTQRFIERMAEPVYGKSMFQVATLSGQMGVGNLDVPPPDDELPPTPPNPLAPVKVIARAGYGVMGVATEPAVDARLAALINNRNPRDFRYISVAAEFPLDRWQKYLQDNLETKGVSRTWLEEKLLVVSDVVLERQTQDPITGAWGRFVNGEFVAGPDQVDVIAPLPGSVTLRGRTDTESWREAEFQQIKHLVRQITEVAFVPLAPHSPKWYSPGTDIERWSREDQQMLFELNEKKAELEEWLLKFGGPQALDVEPAIAPDVEKPRDGDLRPGAGDADTTRPGLGGRVAVNPGQAAGPSRTPRPSEREETIKKRKDEFADVLLKLNTLRARYEAPDADEERQAAPAAAPNILAPPDPLAPPAARPLPDPGAPKDEKAFKPMPLLAHDLSVRAGMTYRYRMRVGVLNPLFKQENIREGDLKEYYDKLTLLSEPEADGSDWGAPITVDPEHFFFVVQARKERNEATVEIWHVYNGRWHAKEFPVRPGDPIGGQVRVEDGGFQTQVDLSTASIMVDLVTTQSTEVAGKPSEQSTVFLYLDLTTGRFRERYPKIDFNDHIRVKLKNKGYMGPVAAGELGR